MLIKHLSGTGFKGEAGSWRYRFKYLQYKES